MKLKEVLDRTVNFFRDKKIETPRLDAELLMAHGLGIERIQLYLKFDQPLSEKEMAPLRELVRRRSQGEPVAYILGYRDFYKNKFLVNSDVLIPRPETEHVVEEVVNWAKQNALIDADLGLIDLGTGSGCLGLSILAELPNAKLISVDISDKAIAVAKQNAEALGVSDRVVFVHCSGDEVGQTLSVYEKFTGKNKIDILVSNPPYIESGDQSVETMVHRFEPHLALYAEDKGFKLLKSWSALYAPHLAAKSLMLMEMGFTQGPGMSEFYNNLNTFESVKIVKDLSGLDRVIRGEKNG